MVFLRAKVIELVKKGLMVQLWRIQQSQSLISLLFWALTLAGVFYLSYFHRYFVDVLHIVSNDQVFIGTMILFLLVIGAFLLIGLIYDRTLKLWREQSDVAVERNPYTKERLMPKDIVVWRHASLPLMKELAKKDNAMQKDIEFMENWIARSLAGYKELRQSVDEIEKWVMS